jgi:hypothetical protein
MGFYRGSNYELYVKYRVKNSVDMSSMYNILNSSVITVYDNESIDIIKYILSDVFLKCAINVYEILVDDTHSIFRNLYYANKIDSVKFIMSDQNIFRLYCSQTIGKIYMNVHDVSIYELLGECSYKWYVDYYISEYDHKYNSEYDSEYEYDYYYRKN